MLGLSKKAASLNLNEFFSAHNGLKRLLKIVLKVSHSQIIDFWNNISHSGVRLSQKQEGIFQSPTLGVFLHEKLGQRPTNRPIFKGFPPLFTVPKAKRQPLCSLRGKILILGVKKKIAVIELLFLQYYGPCRGYPTQFSPYQVL